MAKDTERIVDFFILNDIEYTDLTTDEMILFIGDFNLTDKALRGLIVLCMKNKFAIRFENNEFFIHP